jgi:hypothetical protein
MDNRHLSSDEILPFTINVEPDSHQPERRGLVGACVLQIMARSAEAGRRARRQPGVDAPLPPIEHWFQQ